MNKPPTFTFSLPGRSSIPTLVTSQSLRFHFEGTAIYGEKLLLALCGKESNFGRQCGLRTEPGYSPTGQYFNDFMKAAYAAYGRAACGSWGPWQILYPTAYELGFRGQPWELFTPQGSLPWVIALINKRIIPNIPQGLPEEDFVAKIGDEYNTGSSKKGIPPKEYIAELWRHYRRPLPELRALFA